MIETTIWSETAGDITLAPSRGRVLQVSVGGEAAFWTPPQPEDGWNVGGDRLWIAPEIAWFWKTRARLDFSQHDISPALDPGAWKVEKNQAGFCRTAQSVRLQHHQSGGAAHFEMARSFSNVSLPEAPFFEAWRAFRADNELRLHELNGGAGGDGIGLWSVLQLPVGGEMLLAGRGESGLRDHFAPIPHDFWQQDEGILRLKISGDHQYKVGVAPRAIALQKSEGSVEYFAEQVLVPSDSFAGGFERVFALVLSQQVEADAAEQGEVVRGMVASGAAPVFAKDHI